MVHANRRSLFEYTVDIFPCTEAPGAELTGYENARVVWTSGDEPDDPCGESMAMTRSPFSVNRK